MFPSAEPTVFSQVVGSIPTVEPTIISGAVLVLKIVSLLLTAVIIAGIILVRRRRQELEGSADSAEPQVIPIPHDAVAERWQNIYETLASDRPNDWKVAVIDADRLLEFSLRHLPLPGETVADKLKHFDRSELRSIDRVWSAHKLRNILVHGEMNAVSEHEAREAVESIGAALRELGVLVEE